MSAVELAGVTKRYGRTTALDDVSLSVRDGELVALVGPSGCGKSTLLMLVAGLLEPDAGTVSVGGRVVAGPGAWVPPEQRRVGVVFQDAALFPHLRVEDNVAFGLPRGRASQAARVAELLALVDLPDLGRRYPHELSGGQQQRVALARALAPQPAVVLFDEAFGNLDSGLRSTVRDATVAALRETGAAGVFVTHDQSEALAVGERVAVMRAGRFEHVAEPAQAFHAPATRFSATLLGEADFLPGRQDGAVVDTEVGRLAVTPEGAGDVEVMLRPHEVVFSADASGTAKVLRREFRGASYVYTLVLPSGAQVRSIQPHTVDVAPGSSVAVGVEAGHPVRSFPRGA
ncbi:MAG: transporter ATP-binding protein [Frankiales bacterium]|jgi:iron(III) transport system ATP-binding protein|nr:transporter ATP-binding protein [Frankiales bacterium]